jgi:putative transposase
VAKAAARLSASFDGMALVLPVAKSFFSSLKRERVRRRTYKTREEARQDVFDYIEMFYNTVRKQVRKGMLLPVNFELQQILKVKGV